MKKDGFEKYIYLMLAGFGAISLSLLFFFVLFRMDTVFGHLGKIAGILMPFIYGGILAYLVYPISKWISSYLDKMTGDRFRNVTSTAGIFGSLFLVAVIIYLLLSMVLPQLWESIISIITGMPAMADNLTKWIADILQDNAELRNYAEMLIETSSQQLETWMTQTLLPRAQELITTLSVSVLATLGGLFDFVIGIIVCIYILKSSDKLGRQARMIIQAVFPKKASDIIFELIYETDQSFGGFIRGKLVDSLIIGVICFVCTSIMNMPYAMLISTIVGITNIIPFFGPFIGAIPSAILILTVDPMKCLYFILFVFVLQQVDGNIIGPAILGQSTGLSSIWVLFSILVFGGLFGFVGMIIGVPLFSVIYFVISKYVFKQLRGKNMEVEIDDYRAIYPDKRIERDEKNLQKSLGKAERLRKWENLFKKK